MCVTEIITLSELCQSQKDKYYMSATHVTRLSIDM